MNRIVINGVVFEVEGNNISIQNGKVKVDGKDINVELGTNATLKVEGYLMNLTTDRSVECGNVQGDVDAGGSVHCGNVEGNIDAGGSVHGSGVGGNIDAGGSVSINK